MIHRDKFFAIKESFNKIYKILDDIYLDMYDIHSPIFFHKHLSMSMQFLYNQQRPSFFHSNMLPNVFSYKVNNLHDGNSFSIYVFYSWGCFNIFYRTGIFVFLNCI